MAEKELLDRVEEARRHNPTLKKQLDQYRERRRAYDEMQRGRGGSQETVGREQRTERQYSV